MRVPLEGRLAAALQAHCRPRCDLSVMAPTLFFAVMLVWSHTIFLSPSAASTAGDLSGSRSRPALFSTPSSRTTAGVHHHAQSPFATASRMTLAAVWQAKCPLMLHLGGVCDVGLSAPPNEAERGNMFVRGRNCHVSYVLHGVNTNASLQRDECRWPLQRWLSDNAAATRARSNNGECFVVVSLIRVSD